MPKAIDDKLIEAMKRAYMKASRPNLREIASDFDVSYSKVTKLAADWKREKAAKEVGLLEGAKIQARSRKVDDLTALESAIADISAEVSAIEARSKEGCATALANLLKAKRELFPPDAEALAEMAVRLDIKPADFIRALKAKWEEHDQQQQSA